MAIAFSAKAESADGSGATSTSSITVAASTKNAVCVVVGYAGLNGGDPGAGSATFDGNAMTQVYSILTNSNHRLYGYVYLMGSDYADGAKNAVMSVTNSTLLYSISAIFTGVSQAVGYRDETSGTAATLNAITCVAGDMLVSVISSFSGSGVSEPTTATETIIHSNELNDGWGNAVAGASYRTATSASESTAWTASATIQTHATFPLIELSTVGLIGGFI